METIQLNNPIKSELISGILSKENNSFSKELCFHNFNLLTGVWNLALSDIKCIWTGAQTDRTEINEFLNISTNFVNGFRYKNTGGLESYYPIIQSFHIKVSKNDPKKFITFEQHWFTLNSPSNKIELNFSLWPERKYDLFPKLQMEAKVLLYRMK